MTCFSVCFPTNKPRDVSVSLMFYRGILVVAVWSNERWNIERSLFQYRRNSRLWHDSRCSKRYSGNDGMVDDRLVRNFTVLSLGNSIGCCSCPKSCRSSQWAPEEDSSKQCKFPDPHKASPTRAMLRKSTSLHTSQPPHQCRSVSKATNNYGTRALGES